MKNHVSLFSNLFNIKVIALLLMSFLTTNVAFTQDDTPTESTEGKRYVCITLVNQIERCGFIMSDDGREIIIETPDMGKLVINKSEIVAMDDAPVNSTPNIGVGTSRLEKDLKSRDQAPQASRYFFAPSAHPMEVGESYIHLNPGMLNYTSQFTKELMGGFALSWFGVGVTGKLSYNISEKSNISMGGLGLLTWYDNDIFLFPYINYTKGDENNHVSVAFATLAYTGNEFQSFDSEGQHLSPMINVSGTKQVGPTSWFITENYFFIDPMFFNERVVLSLGGRWFKNQRRVGNAFTGYAYVQANNLMELGFMMIIADDQIIPVPWIGWTWPL